MATLPSGAFDGDAASQYSSAFRVGVYKQYSASSRSRNRSSSSSSSVDKEATLACTVHQSPQQCICSARKELLRNTGCYSTSNDEVG